MLRRLLKSEIVQGYALLVLATAPMCLVAYGHHVGWW